MARGRRSKGSTPPVPPPDGPPRRAGPHATPPESTDGTTGSDLSRYETVDYEDVGPATPPGGWPTSRTAAAPAEGPTEQRTRDVSMSELDQTSGTAGPDREPSRTAEPRHQNPPPRRRGGGWLGGFIGGLLGSAVLLAGGAWYLYEHGPGRATLGRFTDTETAARNAEAATTSLGTRVDQLQTNLEQMRPTLDTIPQRIAAAEQVDKEIAGALQQITARLDDMSQEINTRFEALSTKLTQVEQSQPADVVDKKTVADIAARQGGLEQSQTRLDGALARIEQILAQGLQASNQQSGALRSVLDQTRTQVDQINTQLRELTALRENVSANEQAVQANRSAIDAAGQQIKDVRSAIEQRLSEVVDRLEQLDAARERGVGLSVAVHSLETAVEDGEPFGSTLSLIRQLGQGDQTVTDIVGRLESVAGSGVPTLAELAQQLEQIKVGEEAAGGAEAQGWLGRTRANLGGLVDLRPAGASTPAGQAIAAASEALILQNLDGAMAAMQPLAQQGNAQAAAWLDAARQRQMAGTAVENLREHVKMVLAQQG